MIAPLVTARFTVARRLAIAATTILVVSCAPAEMRAPASPATTPSFEPTAPSPAPPPASNETTTGGAAPTSAPAGETDATSKKPTPAPSATIAAPTPLDDVPHAQATFDESAQVFTSAGTDCAKMCKALASMERAAGHLCDLVKDGAAAERKKCTDAKARLDHARDRVMSTCGGCD